ncbi:MAG: PhoH family protein [Planctomycetaceae bacterium]|jgi:phosphate starvation-inducible PhoH-like protein|nr:PhoH family protein [Planctomycetaceae bacterium]
MSEQLIPQFDVQTQKQVFGDSDSYLRVIRTSLGVQVIPRGGDVLVRGEADAVQHGATLLERLRQMAKRDGFLTEEDVRRSISEVLTIGEVSDVKPIEVFSVQRVRPKTAGQTRYLEMLRSKEIVFAVGPAGTGKTYLAVARAVEIFRQDEVRKIVLVRPAVEAGESLGFLPGDLLAKVNPYLRPLFDALSEMIDPDILKRYMTEDRIEVIPLAYMRGRTLNNAAIILDEAQNTTVEQMKMFLTRMGTQSHITVCGDTTQVDLPTNKKSGLSDALNRLKDIEGIGIIHLTGADIVRHRLVQEIVEAYEVNSAG